MSKRKKPILIFLIIGVLIASFYIIFSAQLSDIKFAAAAKSDLIREHIKVSSNIIEGLATYGNNFFEQGIKKDARLLEYIKYDSGTDSYHLNSIGGTAMEKSAGNLTGLGPIPPVGLERDNLNLALNYNEFFNHYYNNFPDIAWLYYTSEARFINIYPWVSSDSFRYTESLKNVEFYMVANQVNNPSRSIVWTPVYPDAAGKGLMVTLSAPIYYKDSFQGVVSLDLTNAWLSKEIASSYECYLIDNKYNVLASSSKHFKTDQIYKLNNYLKFSQSDIKKLTAFQDGSVQTFGGYYIYCADFENAPWKMIFLVPVWIVVGRSAIYTIPIFGICVSLLLALKQIEKRRESEALLAKKNSLLETTLFSIEEGIIVTDRSGTITLMNKAAEEFTGWTSAEALGQNFSVVFHITNILTKENGFDPVKKALESGESVYFGKSSGLISKDGSEIYISGVVTAVNPANGMIGGTVVSFRDITKEYEQEKQIEAFLELNLDMLCVVNINGNLHRVNRKFEEITGYRPEEVEGINFRTFLHDEDTEITLAAIEQLKQNKAISGFTNRFRCKDGSYKYIEWHAQPHIGKFIYSSARDVTEQMLKAEELETMAEKDPLTGAYNRHYLDSIIAGEMARADYYNEQLSIALIDMDHFKNVNDTWGHPIGDEVLRQISETIQETIRDADALIRFGGEEFLLLMPKTSVMGADVAAEKIRAAIERKQHPVAGCQTASIGTVARVKNESFESLYRRVDRALYEAKKNGRNRVFVSEKNSTPG